MNGLLSLPFQLTYWLVGCLVCVSILSVLAPHQVGLLTLAGLAVSLGAILGRLVVGLLDVDDRHPLGPALVISASILAVAIVL